MDVSEFEKKRAANLIWNGAMDYSIEPGFRVYDEEGRADVYWNSIVGAAHRHYDWDKLENFYRTFNETVDQTVYESLFWLAVENGTYLHEKDARPVFPYLRRQYALRQLDALHGAFSLEDSAGQRLLGITRGHFRRAIGEDAGLPDLVDVHLLDAIEIGADLDTDAFIERMAKTLSTYFTYRLPGQESSRPEKKIPSLRSLFGLVRPKKPKGKLQPVRKLSFGYGEHVKEYGSEILDQSHLSVAFAAYTAQTDEGLREYIRNSFGKPILTQAQIQQLQKDYCWGNHTDVRLYYTDGSYTQEMLQQGYAGKMKKEGIAQAKKNEEVYEKDGARHRLQIEKLSERIRNVLQTHREDADLRTRSGEIVGRIVWREIYVHDPRVFHKVFPSDTGDFTVDLLLDASTSQLHRQEIVSAQGYMIAESLTRCGIPVRVSSFCSLNGYTIITRFRDYGEVNADRNIFRYFTSGANRDGLAVRLAAGAMRDNHAQHRLLILLSDAKPNDALKMRTSTGQYEDYAGDAAVADTAAEVHKAKMQGITVLCVYTGPEKDTDKARAIYGRDFVRISSLDQFADAVGSLIQKQIQTF